MRNIFIFLVLLFAFWFLIFNFAPLTYAKGLVPCGGTGEPACTWCHLGIMADKIIDFVVLYIVIPVAVAFIIWGGFLLMTAGGSPERVKRGRDAITAAVIGIVVALGAWLIIDTIVKMLTSGAGLPSDLGPWNKIKC